MERGLSVIKVDKLNIRPFRTRRRSGFSLMEVNMAIFVMAVGTLGMVALFPLGLREGVQGRADMRQSMFADHALNQLAGLLSQTNITWSEWVKLDKTAWPADLIEPRTVAREEEVWPRAQLPASIANKLKLMDGWQSGGSNMRDNQYRIFFQLIGGPEARRYSNQREASARIMGIGVRSTNADVKDYRQYNKNVLYYTEVLFRGDPDK